MNRRIFLGCVFVLAVPMAAAGIPLVPVMDTPTFVAKSTDLLVIRCINRDVIGREKTDGLTLIEVEVIAVIKGDRKVGKTKLATIGQEMAAGKRYLMASFGGSAFETGFVAQSEQSVVQLPDDFDLKSIAGKPAVEQVQAIFDARRAEVELMLKRLQREKAMLDRSKMKPESPGE